MQTIVRSVISAVTLFGVAACHNTARHLALEGGPDTASMSRDVRFLASDALEGRLTGTAGNDSAAAYIARRFRTLGLRPIVADSAKCQGTPPCAPSFEQ